MDRVFSNEIERVSLRDTENRGQKESEPATRGNILYLFYFFFFVEISTCQSKYEIFRKAFALLRGKSGRRGLCK